jgi:hypothetical protein
VCFPHRFQQILAAVTIFLRIVPVLSSNSKSKLEIGPVFAYELGFRRSIYQNRSEKKNSDMCISRFARFKKICLAKNWSQDPLFLVTSFSSILDPSSKFSTGHVFHLFKLKFSVVTSFVLLSEEKISKK